MEQKKKKEPKFPAPKRQQKTIKWHQQKDRCAITATLRSQITNRFNRVKGGQC